MGDMMLIIIVLLLSVGLVLLINYWITWSMQKSNREGRKNRDAIPDRENSSNEENISLGSGYSVQSTNDSMEDVKDEHVGQAGENKVDATPDGSIEDGIGTVACKFSWMTKENWKCLQDCAPGAIRFDEFLDLTKASTLSAWTNLVYYVYENGHSGNEVEGIPVQEKHDSNFLISPEQETELEFRIRELGRIEDEEDYGCSDWGERDAVLTSAVFTGQTDIWDEAEFWGRLEDFRVAVEDSGYDIWHNL